MNEKKWFLKMILLLILNIKYDIEWYTYTSRRTDASDDFFNMPNEQID
jgi:hypothetical protein